MFFLCSFSDLNINFTMKYTINHILRMFIPLLPIRLIKLFSNRYVAGTSIKEALKSIQNLNDNGLSATIDILGEHTNSTNEADNITSDYIEIYKALKVNNLDCNISIKPSHIGLDLGFSVCHYNLDRIIKTASDVSNFLRIDMESSSATNDTITLYNTAKNQYQNVGTVFQAYLKRTLEDVRNLDRDSNFRLCKGIYKENSEIAFQGKEEINDNFIKILDYALNNRIYVCIATHDPLLLERCYQLINKYKIKPERFEFQVLFGVPMDSWIKKHKLNNYKVRVYVPFGKSWYEYSMRRLNENPNIIGYIIKNFFKA